MTEEEWKLKQQAESWGTTGKPQWLVGLARDTSTDRKWRLMGAAFAKTCEPDLTHPDADGFVRFCEHYAEGTLSDGERSAAVGLISRFGRRQQNTPRQDHCVRVLNAVLTMNTGVWTANGLAHILQIHRTGEGRKILCDIIRDIFGNPFRPVALDPAWRSESAVALARAAYESRNFTLLPILADALEEAGCDHPDILAHCRGPGPHARGCWVADGVLGKN